MAMQASWRFLDVEELAISNPEFFCHPLRSVSDRMSIRAGELVKVPVRSSVADGSELYGRFMIVHHVHRPGRYSGRLMQGYHAHSKQPNNLEETHEFTAANIYRLPPREFTLWGSHSVPCTIYGGAGRPRLDDGSLKPGCPDSIVHFKACGWDEAIQHYTILRKSHPDWPSFEELAHDE